jgi:pilus assembly protein FimV
MPHTKAALVLMVAFTLPSAAEALGLGEIHVVSALNEPLVAEVEIVGATAEDLAGISASIANPETFLRFGVDRPAFLSSAAFKVAMNGNGQPVLAIRSMDAFTEPLINILIDLRWHSGELIRQYTLLLDPAEFRSDTRVAEAAPNGSGPGAYTAPAAAEPVSQTSQPPLQSAPSPERTSPAVRGPAPPQTVRVAAGATLRGIALRVGSRGDAGLERMMIAIYRANPKAFESNINRLRLGAVLTIPSDPEISKISVADANHEVRLQMETWRASPKLVNPAKSAEPAVAASAPVPFGAPIPTEPAAARKESTSDAPQGEIRAPGNAAESSDDAALHRRVRRLEEGLGELQSALSREQGALAAIQTRVARTDNTPAARTDNTPAVRVVPPTAKSGHGIGASIAALLVLASGALGVVYVWRGRRTVRPMVAPAEATMRHLGAPHLAAQPATTREVAHAAPDRNEPPPPAQIEARSRAQDEVQLADASTDELTILRAEVLDGIDVESSNASYFSESAGGLEHTIDLKFDAADTATLASPSMKTGAPDANAETTPLEAVRVVDVSELSAPEHLTPDNMTPADESGADTAKIQYKPLDLDGVVHHIPMPSMLNEKGGFKERRTSLVDVLKVAVKREPNRRDLRLKLLETYYAAAATSRQGFLEVAQSLAGERESMSDGEWSKIAGMGRQIAADNDLFMPGTAPADRKEGLATCA